MFNPRPPLLPAADPKSPSTADSTYETDQPYEQLLPHALGTQKRHAWFEVFDIGVGTLSGGNAVTYKSPLTTGSEMRIHVDQPPDFWLISLVVNTAGAQIQVFRGPNASGIPIRLGNGGMAKIPAMGLPDLAIQNSSGQSVVGTVIALAGWRETDVLLNCANQA